MERGLKERLVGAAVLVALAVIFIPMLLDESPSGPGPITETNIPPQPDAPIMDGAIDDDGEFNSRIVPVEPEQPVTVEPPPELPPTPQPDEVVSEPAGVAPADTAAPTDDEPVTSSEQTSNQAEDVASEQSAAENRTAADQSASGWVVQLGSFSKQDNAEDLNKQLKAAGYAAFVEPITQSGERIYRVRVGPEVLRGKADDLRDAINAEFDLKGIVVSYP